MASGVELEKRPDGTISIGTEAAWAKWVLLVLVGLVAIPGVWGLFAADELPHWAVVVAAVTVGLSSAGLGCWAIATVAEVELRGLITEVWHVEIRRIAAPRHYRDMPDRPILKAAGRRWPLEKLRRIDIGEEGEKLELYLVLEDEVLRLVPAGSKPGLVETAKALGEALGVPLERRPDRSWQSATWSPALLVFPLLITAFGGPWIAWELARAAGPLPAAAVGLASALFPVAWRFLIARVTRRGLLPAGRAYVRERFGIEPRV